MPAATTNTTSPPATPSPEHKPFAGKVAVITGAGRGIGRGIALELARKGASVIVNYSRSAAAAAATVAEIEAMGGAARAVQADVARAEATERLFAEAEAAFGGVDFVISNAGMEAWCPDADVTEELFDRVFGLNCRGQFFVAQQALRRARRGGRIVLTGSIAASLTGIPDHALYAGSKAAVEGFCRALAVDAGPRGLTVNCIAPGGVKTDMYADNSWHYVPGGYKGMPLDVIDAGLAKMCPLGRVGTPADIGKAVGLLCSEEGEWINGQVIKLTGGGI